MDPRAWPERLLARDLHELRIVVRAHLLADVAPVDPVPDQRPQLVRYRSLELDRQVGDATPGVHDRSAGGIVPEEGAGGTRGDAARARAAEVNREWLVVVELHIDQDGAEK